MITKDQLEAILAGNTHWTTGCPGIAGLDYQQCLAKWEIKKLITIRKIKKDLDTMEFLEREKTGNNQMSMEVMSLVAGPMASANWQSSCGTFPIWNGMFSRAQGVARKNLTGKSDLDLMAKGLLKK